MRHLISGVVAAVAVMAAAPAMACGYSSCASPCGYSYSPCAQPRYVAPVATYSYGYGCGCGSTAPVMATVYRAPRRADQPVLLRQPGSDLFGSGRLGAAAEYASPRVSGWSNYSRPYNYGYVARPRTWGPRAYGYGYGYRAARPYGYGYAPRRMHAAPIWSTAARCAATTDLRAGVLMRVALTASCVRSASSRVYETMLRRRQFEP